MMIPIDAESVRWIGGIVIALETWQVKEIFSIKRKIAVIQAACCSCNDVANKPNTMKRTKLNLSNILFFLALLAIVACFAGCVAAPGSHPPLLTQTATGTNSAGEPFPVYSPAPAVQTGIDTAKQVSTFLPPPISSIATPALALLSAGLGLYARLSNKRAAAASDTLQTASDALNAVAAGVEASGNSTVKALIQAHAAAAGGDVAQFLDTVVQDVSKNMPAPPAKT